MGLFYRFLSSVEMASNFTLVGSRLSMNLKGTVIYGLLLIILTIGLISIAIYQHQKGKVSKLQQENADALAHMVNHDTTTGLCHRNHLLELLQEELLAAENKLTALYVVDVVNLRTINDAYGHDMGDEVLRHVTAIIQDEFKGKSHQLGIYHTQFLIVEPEVSEVENIQCRGAQLIRRLSQTTFIDRMEIGIKVNMGISFAPDHSIEAKLLLKKANVAQAEAMRIGPNQFNIFQGTLYKDALKRIAFEKQLRKAAINDEFELFYQPRISMADFTVIGCEALIRWHHPDGKLVYPGDFIPLAESLGFIREITKWVVVAVARQAVIWEQIGYDIKISFNISGKEFDDDFIEMLSKVIVQENVNPQLLEVEITETATLADLEHSRILVNTLNHMGLSVALDDFGSGYSSMSYIKKLNAGKLKIDRSFVEDIHEHQQKVVVESMIQLGRKLNYTINVEGVETKEQLEILKSMEVDEMQGWYFSKAISVKELMTYIKQNKMKNHLVAKDQ